MPKKTQTQMMKTIIRKIEEKRPETSSSEDDSIIATKNLSQKEDGNGATYLLHLLNAGMFRSSLSPSS